MRDKEQQTSGWTGNKTLEYQQLWENIMKVREAIVTVHQLLTWIFQKCKTSCEMSTPQISGHVIDGKLHHAPGC